MGTSSSDHYDEELQDALDGRLDAPSRAKLEAHLLACPSCRERSSNLARLKQRLVRLAGVDRLPASLATDVARALDAEDDRAAARPGTSTAGVRRWRPALAWSVAAAAALLLAFLYAGRTPDLPSAVARDYRDYRSGAQVLALETDDVARMERFFSEEGVPFQTRVFDLAMMKHRLVGGRVHRLAGRKSALFVYRREDGYRVVCQMYAGHPEELPASDERREHDGIAFFVYRIQGLTLVFWREGEVMCVLTGEHEGEEVIQLAFAKAMKAAHIPRPPGLAHPRSERAAQLLAKLEEPRPASLSSAAPGGVIPRRRP